MKICTLSTKLNAHIAITVGNSQQIRENNNKKHAANKKNTVHISYDFHGIQFNSFFFSMHLIFVKANESKKKSGKKMLNIIIAKNDYVFHFNAYALF